VLSLNACRGLSSCQSEGQYTTELQQLRVEKSRGLIDGSDSESTNSDAPSHSPSRTAVGASSS